jgi:Tfp pilus assembly protein PilV
MLEALVAFSILAFAMLSFTTAAVALTRGEKEADSTAQATALAIEQLELLRHLPLESAQHTPGNYSNPSNPITGAGDPNGRYNVTWSVSNRDVPDFGLKTILVNVAWNDTRARSVRIGGFVRCSEVPCP